MIIQSIIKSFSNEAAAERAIAAIGEDLATEVRAVAGAWGMSDGAYATMAVRRFELTAGDAEWRGLAAAVSGAPKPMLAGLRFLIERTLQSDGAYAGGMRANRAA